MRRLVYSRLLLRGLLAWLGIRTTVQVVMAMFDAIDEIPLGPGPGLIVIGLAATIVWLDARRAHLGTLLPNLGVASGTAPLLAVLGALPAELVLNWLR